MSTMTTNDPTHHRTRPQRHRRWSAVAPAAVLALTPLAACGGDDSDASEAAASSDAAGTAGGDDMAAFQECLAGNGVEMGGAPGQGSDGEQPAAPDQDAMAQAQEACGDLMPEGGPGGGAGGPGGMGGEEMQAWTDCLADNGVELTQPEMGEPGEMPQSGEMPDAGDGSGTPFGLDTSDPEVAAAVEACADLQPEMGQPPSDGTAGESDTSTGNTSSDGSEA